jgi:parallel beta-helix repeat protein
LYVGGSGPGNYTRIQDAINDSSDDDTVFVYDDSSPYYENIFIKKEIRLIGENRTTTIITGNGSEQGTIVLLTANYSSIQNFTFKDSHVGIMIDANSKRSHITISYLTIKNCSYGIIGNSLNLCEFSYNLISMEQAQGMDGISLVAASNISIHHNIIQEIVDHYSTGIDLWSVFHSNIYANYISMGNGDGISLLECFFNKVFQNILVNNTIGILLEDDCFSIIKQNTFIKNIVHATFWQNHLPPFNLWLGNYWGRSHLSPKPIFGLFIYIIPLVQFDWRPALKPYDIVR